MGQAPLTHPGSFYKNTITPTQGRGERLIPDWLEDGMDAVDGVRKSGELRPPARPQRLGPSEGSESRDYGKSERQHICPDKNYTQASGDSNLLEDLG